MQKIQTSENLVDVMTKSVSIDKVIQFDPITTY